MSQDATNGAKAAKRQFAWLQLLTLAGVQVTMTWKNRAKCGLLAMPRVICTCVSAKPEIQPVDWDHRGLDVSLRESIVF